MNAWPFNLQVIRDFLNNHLHRISADTLGWLAAIVLHCGTLPSLLALMTGLSKYSSRKSEIDMVQNRIIS